MTYLSIIYNSIIKNANDPIKLLGKLLGKLFGGKSHIT